MTNENEESEERKSNGSASREGPQLALRSEEEAAQPAGEVAAMEQTVEPAGAGATPEAPPPRSLRRRPSRRALLIGGGVVAAALLFGSGFAAGSWAEDGGHESNIRIAHRGLFAGREMPRYGHLRPDSHIMPFERGRHR